MTKTDPPPQPHRTVDELERALSLVHTEILKQARIRGWCSEYEQVVDQINATMGFPALGKRLTRRTATWTVELRMRGTQLDVEYSMSEFIQYVKAYPGERLVDCFVNTEYAATGVTVDEPLNAEDMGRPPGWLDGACNCETCLSERRRDIRAVRVRIT